VMGQTFDSEPTRHRYWKYRAATNTTTFRDVIVSFGAAFQVTVIIIIIIIPSLVKSNSVNIKS